MKARVEHFTEKNPNPVLSAEKNGTVIYSNETGEPLINEWGVEVGERLPSYIGDIIQRVLCNNIPERIEVKAGEKIYLVAFHPSSEEGCVNIYGFDISDQKAIEEKLRESEEKHRNLMKIANEGIVVVNDESLITYVNEKVAEMLECTQDEIIGKSVSDFTDEDGKTILEQNMKKRREHIDDSYELKLINKDGPPLWIIVNSKSLFGKNGKFMGSLSMLTDITRRKQEEQRTRRYNRILEGINWIFSNVVQAKTEEELGEACLSVALEVTGSQFGFIIEMGTDGLLHDVAKSELAWEQCLMYDKRGHIRLPSDYVVHGLYGSVIINEKSLFTNDPQSHPDSLGVPPGHPSLNSFLGVPLILDGKTIGSIAVANREGGYSYEQQEDLEAIAPAVTQVLQRRKVEQKRKLAEQELKASELRFKALVQDLESGVVLIDGEGNFAIYNPAFLKIFNISEQELEHMKIQDLRWDTWNVVGKDGNALRFESHPVQYARINHKPLKNQVIGIRRYSHEDWVWTLASAEPLLNSDGSIDIIICTFTDITQLKNTEDSLQIANETLEEKVKKRTEELEKAYRTLKEKEELLSDAQGMAHIGNWELNFETSELHWSDEMYRIFGLKPQELEVNYDLFLSHLHPDDQDYVNNAVKGALSGKPFSTDHRVILANGEVLIAHSKGETFFDKENNPVRIRGTTQDITERKKAEETLRNFEIARKKELHHRIKNNLQVISSLLDLQADLFKGRKTITDSEVLKAFKDSIDRVLSIALIHEELYKGKNIDLLNFSQYIKELANNLILTYSLKTYVSINFDLEENIFLNMDTAIPLGIAINEIVSNSFKYAFSGRDKGEIKIKLQSEGNGESKSEEFASSAYVLSVSDNGIGIPEDLKIEGLDSLGLQLVTSLVDQLDGELQLKRNNGTEFTIRFNVTEKDDLHHASPTIN